MKLIIFVLIFFFINKLSSQIPDLENKDKSKIKQGLSNTFIRSMNKWDIPFNDLLENRSGAACVNWSLVTDQFLENGIFDALGYSQNIPNKKASEIAAISGCKKMKDYYKLKETCSCQVIVTNDETVIKLPIKKFDLDKEFKTAVSLYKNKDYESSFKQFLLLSEKGDVKSQYNLAVIFYKGEGITQNFKKSYYWSLISHLSNQKESIKILNNSKKRLTDEEIGEINDEVKDYLESIVNKGEIYPLIPLAKWYLTIPKKPDFDNSYKWLSVATALEIPNTKKARDKIFKNVKKNNLSELQSESNEIYNTIISAKNSKKNGE